MAAGAGGDPAAEGREAEALREVAQREPVRAELVLQRRAVDAGLDAGGAETASISRTRSNRSMATVTTASASGGFTPHTTDDPAPNGTTLASLDVHQSSTDSSSVSVRGWATASVGLGKRRWKASVRSVRWAPWEWNARSHVSVVHTSASESGTDTRDGRKSASANDGTGRGVIDDAEPLREVLGAARPGRRRTAPRTPTPMPRTTARTCGHVAAIADRLTRLRSRWRSSPRT